MPQFRVRNVEQLNVRSEPKLVADNIIGILKRDETVEQLACCVSVSRAGQSIGKSCPFALDFPKPRTDNVSGKGIRQLC